MRFPKGNWGPDGLTIDLNCPLVRFTVNGAQVLECTPLELPSFAKVPEPLEVVMARMVRDEISRAAVAAGHESLEEAYDFEMADDDSYEDELTPAELHAMMHSPMMKDEVLKPKEKANVRERVGAGEESVDDADKGVADRSGRIRERVAEEDAGDGKGSREQGEAVRVRGSADGRDGAGVGGSSRRKA